MFIESHRAHSFGQRKYWNRDYGFLQATLRVVVSNCTLHILIFFTNWFGKYRPCPRMPYVPEPYWGVSLSMKIHGIMLTSCHTHCLLPASEQMYLQIILYFWHDQFHRRCNLLPVIYDTLLSLFHSLTKNISNKYFGDKQIMTYTRHKDGAGAFGVHYETIVETKVT